MGNYPGNLDDAVAAWLAGQGRSLAGRSAALTTAYAGGRPSREVDPAAYLVARAPATFAATARVLAQAAEALPDMQPSSLLDLGAGPGTASWAALRQWPSLSRLTLVEEAPAFARLAEALCAGSGIDVLQAARLCHGTLQALAPDEHADVVLASYVLAELPLDAMPETVAAIWQRAGQTLVLVEPGTPQGFARIHAARKMLLASGAQLAAPCTHGGDCPMAGGDWCHFKVRLPRSRLHMHAKGATVPFEDEAFSYLVATRMPVRVGGHRVLAPPQLGKAGVSLKLCGGEGFTNRHVPARDRDAFKPAKKLQWGDVLR